MSSWKDATSVQKMGDNVYTCTLHDEWCIGSVPNGGYVTGCLLEVVKTHFCTTLAKQNQPHTIALHVEFLRRTSVGSATFTVDEVKLGRQTSVVHVRMVQDGREEVLAYATNSNMDNEAGVSFDTGYVLASPPPPVSLEKLENDEDEHWYLEKKMPDPRFRKALQRLKFHFPRAGHVMRNIVDEWLCFVDGSKFTDTSIGFLADVFPLIVERFFGQEKGPFWYPTLLLNLDIKTKLPPEGLKWLRVRAQIKQVKNGRKDYEVHIHDDAGDLIALSHHVAFVVDAARNTAVRRQPETKL